MMKIGEDPIVVLDGLLVALAFYLSDDSTIWRIIILAWVILVVLFDVYIARTVWRWATRPVSTDSAQ